MKMQYRKWYACTVVSALLGSVAYPCVSEATMAAGTAAGTASGQLSVSKFGSQSSSNTNISVPMTNSTTQMYTVDGSKAFNGSISAPSSNKFLQVMIQPSPTGDLSKVLVTQDRDVDGTIDYTFEVPFPVSGVCANGLIGCDPGTWSSCKWYKWIADANHAVSLLQLGGMAGSISELGGCYCINAHCGSQLAWSNAAVLLKDIGGGAVGAINSADGQVMITNVETSPVDIKYYGNIITKSSNVAIANGFSSPASSTTVNEQAAYFSNPGSLDSYKDTVALTYGTDTDSLYYKLTHSVAADASSAVKKCSVNRIASVASNPTASYQDSGYAYFFTEHFIDMQLWRSPDLKTYKLQLMDHWNGVDHHGGTMSMQPYDSNGFFNIHTFTIPEQTATFQSKLTSAIFSLQISPSIPPYIQDPGCTPGSPYVINAATQGFNTRINVGGFCSGGGVQHAFLKWAYFFEFTEDTFVESIQNDCTALENDPECRLRELEIDGVYVARNYGATGLSQMASCKQFTGLVKNMMVCRDWWQQKRTYVCSAPPLDFSALGTRYGAIENSVTDTGTSIMFTDNRKDANNNWVSSSENFQTGTGKVVGSGCESVCRVKKQNTENNQASPTGVSSTNRITPNTDLISYRGCLNNICPLMPDEVIVSNCSCADGSTDFGKAATVMQLMRLAGGDQMCSSGVMQ